MFDASLKDMKILILNGPNLNRLGLRKPEIYGSRTMAQILLEIQQNWPEVHFVYKQSNHEGDLVDKIQAAYGNTDGIVFNPAAYTHTSVALLDALKAVSIPTVEVHISDVASREDFRQVSYVRAACIATVAGHGLKGYLEAMDLLIGDGK